MRDFAPAAGGAVKRWFGRGATGFQVHLRLTTRPAEREVRSGNQAVETVYRTGTGSSEARARMHTEPTGDFCDV